MSNFAVRSLDDAPEKSRPILEGAKKKYGFVPNLLGVLAESPTALSAYGQLSEIFSGASLSPAEQQVVLLTVSFESRCGYCMSAHTMIAQNAGLSADHLEALRRGTQLSDARLEALRRFTRKAVEKRGWVDEVEVAAFLAAGYDKAQVLEVITGIALKTISNYTNHLSETPLDEAFAKTKWEHKEAVATA